MRDIDAGGMGHNTSFPTRIPDDVLAGGLLSQLRAVLRV